MLCYNIIFYREVNASGAVVLFSRSTRLRRGLLCALTAADFVEEGIDGFPE